MGFEAVEESDGTIDLSRKERDRVIHEARKLNLQVLSECGKKAAGSSLEIALIKETLLGDIEMGASHMIIEGRESGVNVGFFDNSGKIAEDSMLLIKEAFKETETIIWEAPKKDQQSLFITLFGSNVNLGNIHHDEVIALEALRRGLRSDTLNLYS
jgi:phosphosulfolactate synthase